MVSAGNFFAAALGLAVHIGVEVGKPVTVVESVQGKVLKGTSAQLLRVRGARQLSIALGETADVQREVVDAGIPTEKKGKYLYH